ncbi:SCO1664 family protein [Gordonia sp. ABSL1-1]|uniref:SCO1664 family protein n=1 Tax=Gordonia sp. ABSL1-1 TaxID=3053923 RepID=UPI002573E0B5|nr:SCO1664 family protein [Gordonia sp. ABSL1-1]MDL9935884.1 SCO1664 family protein [Gordonia sp. ABSL1-1]
MPSADPLEVPDDGPSPSEILRTGELVVVGRIPSASNVTLVCDAVLGDRELRCVYKPVRGEVPLWDFPDGTLAGREVASYLISQALGWDVIPETVLRDGPVGPGMLQRWISTPDNTERSHSSTTVSATDPFIGASELPATRVDLVDLCPPDAMPTGFRAVLEALDGLGEPVLLVHADDPRLQRIAVLDVILNNADRKGGHVLEALDGGVYGIDHGICLHTDDKLRTVLWGWAGEPVPAHLVSDLRALEQQLADGSTDLRTALAEHITADELDALSLRITILAASAAMPEPPPHRPIPWPPF